MAEGKKSIVVYSDWIKKFEALNDDEAGKLIKHFFRYVNDLNPVAPDRITELSFIDIEASLKRDLVKWEKRAERSRENGKSGGRPLTEKPIETQQVILKPRKPDSVNDNVSVNVNDNVINNASALVSAGSSKSVNQDKTESFEWFWNQYGKKIEYQKCLKKFLNLKKADIDKIMIVVPMYVKSTPDLKYRKNPATWINNKCWNDEIDANSIEVKHVCIYGGAMGKFTYTHSDKESQQFLQNHLDLKLRSKTATT